MSHPSSAPADGLLHPVVWLAVGILVVNDHWLKGSGLAPGWLTGKLSDAAGMVFFPLVLQAVVEWGQHRMGRPWGPSRRVLVASAVACGAFFGGIQLSTDLARIWTGALGIAQWPIHGVHAVVRGAPLPSIAPTAHTADPTDLFMVPFVVVAVWVGWARGHGGGSEVP